MKLAAVKTYIWEVKKVNPKAIKKLMVLNHRKIKRELEH
jgi:hypothetical protein